MTSLWHQDTNFQISNNVSLYQSLQNPHQKPTDIKNADFLTTL